MQLYYLRHGIAEEVALSDADRRLTATGRERCAEAAAGLRWLGVQPDVVWTSPLIRARETAALALPDHPAEVRTVLANYPPEAVLDELRALPDDATVLCVGHEPQGSELVRYLLQAAGQPTLKKAGLVKLAFSPATWPDVPAVLEYLLAPRQLRRLGEMRD